MPDFTLRAPDSEGGGEHVVGNAQDRALLLSRGYKEITDSGDGEPAERGDTPPASPARQPSRARTRENPAPGVEVNPAAENS